MNAIRGFIDSVATLITREAPDRLVVCLDLDWRPRFRVDLIPSYKAHRIADQDGTAGERPADESEEVPDDLSPQIDVILSVLHAFGIATAGAEGFEADDVLGTLAAAERRSPVVVVSGDRDLLQVVADEPVPVRVLYIGRGLSKAVMFGPAEVAERYRIPEERAGAAYAELALLRGDPSDGLPGVPGIGEKTAATMLSKYGSLEQIMAAANDPRSSLPKALRAKLLAAADYIAAAGPVVTVARDAPVQSSRDDRLPRAAVDPARVAQLAKEHGISSSIARLQKSLDGLSR